MIAAYGPSSSTRWPARGTSARGTLQDLSRDRLKELCREFALDDSGRWRRSSSCAGWRGWMPRVALPLEEPALIDEVVTPSTNLVADIVDLAMVRTDR